MGRRISLFAAAWLTLASPAAAQEPSLHDRAIAAGYKALFLCSGTALAERTPEQIERDEFHGTYAEYMPIFPSLDPKIDRNGDQVTVSVPYADDLPPRVARGGDLGCTIMPIGAKPVAIAEQDRPDPSRFASLPWPMGEKDATARGSAALDALAATAFDRASYGAGSETTAVVVVKDGKIVAERYRDDYGANVPQRTWSVAKSMAGTLIGIAHHKGLLDPNAPASIPEWRTPGDPRAAIKLDNLLRMASGLYSDTAGNRTDLVYFGGTSVTERTVGWPVDVLPDTRFRYANNDTLLAVRALRAALGDDAAYSAFPYAELFDKIGMTRTTAETDWQGNFILSSQVWTTARDLARFGLLYLNDGVWNGERLIPEDWVDYVTTPSGPQPAKGPGYGATFWLFGPEQGLPAGSYAAQGNRGQYVMVVPSEKLVVVRRGFDAPGQGFDIARFTADIVAARQ